MRDLFSVCDALDLDLDLDHQFDHQVDHQPAFPPGGRDHGKTLPAREDHAAAREEGLAFLTSVHAHNAHRDIERPAQATCDMAAAAEREPWHTYVPPAETAPSVPPVEMSIPGSSPPDETRAPGEAPAAYMQSDYMPDATSAPSADVPPADMQYTHAVSVAHVDVPADRTEYQSVGGQDADLDESFLIPEEMGTMPPPEPTPVPGGGGGDPILARVAPRGMGGFDVGDYVEVAGLVAAPELNGVQVRSCASPHLFDSRFLGGNARHSRIPS